MVGDLIDAVVGHVADGNAAGPRGREVDVVDADAVADDHPRPLHRGHDVGVHRGELRDHGISIGDRRREGGDVFRLRGDKLPAGLAHDGFLDGEIRKSMIRHDDAHGTRFLGEREPHSPITVDCRLFVRNLRGQIQPDRCTPFGKPPPEAQAHRLTHRGGGATLPCMSPVDMVVERLSPTGALVSFQANGSQAGGALS